MWRWGAPQGLAPINDETRAHLQTNYAVTTQRPGILQEPHVIEVRRENSAGTPRDYGLDFDYEPGHARLSLHYAADGAVSSIDAFDASDRLARQYAFDWDAKNQAVLTFKLGAVEVAQSATTSLLDDGTFSSGQQNQPKTDITDGCCSTGTVTSRNAPFSITPAIRAMTRRTATANDTSTPGPADPPRQYRRRRQRNRPAQRIVRRRLPR